MFAASADVTAIAAAASAARIGHRQEGERMSKGGVVIRLVGGVRTRAAALPNDTQTSDAGKAAASLKACLEYAAGQAAAAGFAWTAEILRVAIASIDEDRAARG
jgi:hypothetical protein